MLRVSIGIVERPGDPYAYYFSRVFELSRVPEIGEGLHIRKGDDTLLLTVGNVTTVIRDENTLDVSMPYLDCYLTINEPALDEAGVGSLIPALTRFAFARGKPRRLLRE